MDIGTHMLTGYMIAWTAAFTVTGYHDHLFLLAVVMAMLPDFDVFLFVIPESARRRFRGLGHRGITHTVIFLLACAAVVAWIFHVVYGTDLLTGIALASVAGLSHTFIDSLTSFSFPALAPFSWKDRSLDLDGAVSWYMVPFSVLSLCAMWWMRVNGVSFGTYQLFVGLVLAVIVCHYMARLAVKLYVERVVYRGLWAKVNPTPTLLKFYVMVKKEVRGTNLIEYMLMKLPRSRGPPERRYIELDRLGGALVGKPADVYEAAVASSGAIPSPRNGDVSSLAAAPLPSDDGSWKFFWFDWKDWSPMRGTPGTLVTIGPDGSIAAENGSRRISW
jgi:membrane-bound metal-dependent hydrolase YbcI (DUF457 family)